LKKFDSFENINVEEFDKETGVGVVVTEEELKKCVDSLFEKFKGEIEAEKWHFNFSALIHRVRDEYKWADGGVITSLINGHKDAILGAKPANWDKENPKKAPAKPKEGVAKVENAKEEEKVVNELYVPKDKLSKLLSRDLASCHNSKEVMEKHNAATGGKVHTRFPPEPNGYLHIGHAKAMRFSFSIADDYGGNCYLRFDDTNPEKECQEYIDSIQNSVAWLGYKPWKVTHTSDYFDQIYQFALTLIKQGNAYVCHQS
jgi:glutaminyl-tRNA synthetase